MSLYLKLKLIQIFNHILLICGIIYVVQTGQWEWLLLSVFCHFFIILGIVCGYHRLLAHKSYETSRFWEIFLTICGLYTTVGSSLTWVGLHRAHHVESEKPNDPHSPYTGRGEDEIRKFSWLIFFKILFNFLNLEKFNPKYIRDLISDPFHKFVHKHYNKILCLTVIVLGLINPKILVFAYAIPACISLHFISTAIVVPHVHGYRTHNTSDESRNSWIANILTMGDGWHNNHHANPGNWTTQEKWWELDPCGWFIRLIKK